jgi:hypothetical protein
MRDGTRPWSESPPALSSLMLFPSFDVTDDGDDDGVGGVVKSGRIDENSSSDIGFNSI